MYDNCNGSIMLVLLAKTRTAVFDSENKVSDIRYKICK